MGVTDRVVLVTGGGSGIGRAIAHHLDDAGARVIVSGRRTDVLEDACRGRDRMSWRCLDVTSENDWAKAVHELGEVEALITSAGIIERASFLDSEASSWDRMWRTNVLGGMFGARTLLPGMLSRGRGRIIFVSSVVATTAVSERCGYAATKGAVEAMMRALAVELGGTGVTSNSIAPGSFRTELNAGVLGAGSPFLENALRVIPEKRLGTPDELGRAAEYLIESGYSQGATIHVDGGWSITGGA